MTKARLELLTLCKRYSDHKWIQDSIDNLDSDFQSHWIGRILPDFVDPIFSAFYILNCIDTDYREWSEIHFKYNMKNNESPIQLN